MLAAIVFTLSVRSFHVPETSRTSAWTPSLPSVPTSRATRVTSEANALSWSTITLIVSLSSRISPWTRTVTFLERSPFATAVVTSAMFRIWLVSWPARRFTLSVRSFQTPPTSSTSAWPPSLPSVPTSRATRVTSEAKEESWSTITLIVFFSSRISPWTSTVTFLDRSPLATAVVTSAMFRIWLVSWPASRFTLSVRSCQTPPTPLTWAWPPSSPSVPTSRATRVTSDVKDESWLTIVLTVLAVRANWPCKATPSTSRGTVWERSPLATAVMTRAVSLVGRTRSSTRSLTELMELAQPPSDPPGEMRWLILPSLPTTCRSRCSSRLKRSLRAMTSLSASATLPETPVQLPGRRAEKSPALNATSVCSSRSVSSSSAVAALVAIVQSSTLSAGRGAGGYALIPGGSAGISIDRGRGRSTWGRRKRSKWLPASLATAGGSSCQPPNTHAGSSPDTGAILYGRLLSVLYGCSVPDRPGRSGGGGGSGEAPPRRGRVVRSSSAAVAGRRLAGAGEEARNHHLPAHPVERKREGPAGPDEGWPGPFPLRYRRVTSGTSGRLPPPSGAGSRGP